MQRLTLRILTRPNDPTTKIVHIYNKEIIGSVTMATRSVADYLGHFEGIDIEWQKEEEKRENTGIGELRRGGFSVL
jgi:hypothetical protein